MLEFTKPVIPILLSLSVVACGGGGGGGSPAQSINQAPQVQAGPDQEVLAGARVTLSGSANDSDGTIASYSWAQDSGDSVALEGADTLTAQFDMPERPISSSFLFTLTVTDNRGLSASDSVAIEHENAPPVASAGKDEAYTAGSIVTLTGTSEDPDGTIDVYSWVQNSGDSVNISGSESAVANFTMPSQPTTDTFEFMFTVRDNRGAESSDTVTIFYINNPPLVNAGPDQDIPAGQDVFLSGSASDIDGTIVSYSWTQESGDEVNLTDAETAAAHFQMPQRPVSTTLVFRFTVTDDGGLTAYDTITINHENTAPTVTVQSGPIGAAGSSVYLIADASDVDGDIVSYQWTQTGGLAVELNDADTANPNFLVPTDAETEILLFSLSVTDNRGASASASITIALSSMVTGRVTFDLVPLDTISSGLDYEGTRVVPARGVLVELVDSKNKVVASTTTDSKGNYSVPAELSSELRVRVSSRMRRGNIWDVKVTDNTNGGALYAGQGELFNPETDDLVRDLHFESGWTGDRYGAVRSAAPFAILDAVYDAKETFVSVDPVLRFPPLEIFWSEKNSTADGSIEEGDIGTSFYQGGNIYILGKSDGDTDEYDRHVVIHEWGHYFEHKLSRSDSIGGPHGSGEKLDLRVAFSEGWGNAISAIVTDDQYYRDSSGKNQALGFSIDVESNDVRNPGWFSEGSIQSILFDLYDEQNEGMDNTNLGFDSIYSVLVSENFKANPFFSSIFTFIDELTDQQNEAISNITGLVEGQSITGTGSDGAGETNDGGIPSALPVYRYIDVNGAKLDKLCTVAGVGAQNKLGNSVFISFDVELAGEHAFNATSVSGALLADVDFIIYKSGVVIATAEGTQAGQEQLNLELDEGRYAMALYGYEISEDTCFDLSITR